MGGEQEQRRPLVEGGGDAMTPRPVALPVIPDAIPAELKARAQWVMWRYVWRDNKWTKPPHTTAGELADSTDPKTWESFGSALLIYRAGGFDGIGYVPTPEEQLTAGDADECRDPESGVIIGPDADALLELDTYTEVSPSGTGIRCFAFGRKPGRDSKKGNFEFYDGLTREGKPGGRYLTVTGHRLDNSPATINHRQAEIEAVYYRHWPKRDPETTVTSAPLLLTDDELLQRAFTSKNGAEVRALFDGDTTGYESESEADLALCNHLAFWFGKDAVAINRVFRTSKLYREKWDREDYRERTIDKAIEDVKDVYEPRRPKLRIPALSNGSSKAHEPPASFTVGCLALRPEPPRRTPAGKITIPVIVVKESRRVDQVTVTSSAG